MNISRCLCCESEDFELVLNLGELPLANNLLYRRDEKFDKYPLELNYCKNCGHMQLSHYVHPDLLFKNYLYVSGTTKTLRDYFEWFASYVTKETNKPLNVLDIACNDGSQLDAFKILGHNTFGIDPAKNLYALSSKNHMVVCDYLNHDSINSFNLKFDLIIAQNVFAHVIAPLGFLELCRDNLATNGKLYIQTSQAKMLERGQFDTIYHEHLSFFSEQSMYTLVDRAGNLKITEYTTTPIHGESHLFRIENNVIHDNRFVPKIQKYSMVKEFREKFIKSKNEIKKQLDKYNHYKIVVYGAAAKSIIYMNAFGIDPHEIVDDNPLKQGLFVPGLKSKIVNLEYFNTYNEPIVWLILAWNFEKEIKERVLKIRFNHNDVFILPDHVK
jgi:SAM-dependent methyltransferase